MYGKHTDIASIREYQDRYIKRQAKVISCNDARFNPQVINSVIDKLCFHACICGQKFYLKKSVKKYCMYFNGLFPLVEGF